MDYYSVTFELQQRQTEAQIEAAAYSKRMERWMAWSVVVLALASVASLVLDHLPFWASLLR
jgi:hypothetical protein